MVWRMSGINEKPSGLLSVMIIEETRMSTTIQLPLDIPLFGNLRGSDYVRITVVSLESM